MTMLHDMLWAEMLSDLPPDRILHDLNQLVQEDLGQSHHFITLFYSAFDPHTQCPAISQHCTHIISTALKGTTVLC